VRAGFARGRGAANVTPTREAESRLITDERRLRCKQVDVLSNETSSYAGCSSSSVSSASASAPGSSPSDLELSAASAPCATLPLATCVSSASAPGIPHDLTHPERRDAPAGCILIHHLHILDLLELEDTVVRVVHDVRSPRDLPPRERAEFRGRRRAHHARLLARTQRRRWRFALQNWFRCGGHPVGRRARCAQPCARGGGERRRGTKCGIRRPSSARNRAGCAQPTHRLLCCLHDKNASGTRLPSPVSRAACSTAR
jgi:hypothetical protein